MNMATATINDEKLPYRESDFLFSQTVANYAHQLNTTVQTEAHKTDLIDDPSAFLRLLSSITFVDNY